MNSAYLLQQSLNALQLASFYVPLALAFAIMQAITRRIFLSFGDLAMFASFGAVYVCFDALVRGQSDFVSGLMALLAAMACGAAIAFVVARIFLGERLLGQPLAFMIASIGVGIAIQETMRLQSLGRNIWVPPLFSGDSLRFLDGSYPVRLPVMTALAVAASITATATVLGILTFTRFGLWWRACAQDLRLARLCAIDAEHVARGSFALAGVLAGVTGWTAAISYGGANFTGGLMVGFKAMFASVIGGFGSLRGALVGAITLAILEVSWSSFFQTSYRDVAVFAVIIMVLVLRPEGLLGVSRHRESENT